MRYLPNKKDNLPANNTEEIISQPLEADIEANRSKLEALLEYCSDVVFREFVIGGQSPFGVCCSILMAWYSVKYWTITLSSPCYWIYG